MMHPLRMVTFAMAFVTALCNSAAATITRLRSTQHHHSAGTGTC